MKRVYTIYGTVYIFVLRVWRAWLEEKNYSIKDNFISANAYTCVEINAHSMLLSIIKLREQMQPTLFLPVLYSSQPCESIFRQIRSMSTTLSTVVNCSLLDIIHRFNKIQLQSDIININEGKIKFPDWRYHLHLQVV